MNRAITVENCLFRYKGHRVPLISGEFHYWRNTAEQWPAIFAAIREMGVKVISTYVPWNFHELTPGNYDFTGKTSRQRDLAGFIDQVAKEGFYLIIRPGPYIYSEWPFGGVPERAAKLHRLDPAFLKMAKHYIDAVSRVIAPRQITTGGPIILCQACNEPYPPIESFAEEIGCFKKPGLFKDFLKAKYNGDLELLNRRWRASMASFDDACVHFHEPCVNTRLTLGQRLLPHPEYYMRYADTMEFVGWYGTEIVREVGGWLRAAGMDVPIFGNGWSPLYQDFAGMNQAADLVGCDVYPMAYFEGDRQTEDDWLYVMDIIKAAAADVKNGNCWSAEFQSGLYPVQTVGYLPPDHFRYMTLAQVARGLRGWNWYMLVTRDNWPNAPINEWGRGNEYYATHKGIVAEAQALEPWNLAEIGDASLLLYKPHRVIDPGNFDDVFRALEAADAGYDYFDPRAGKPPTTGTVIYAGSDWLERDVEATLADFVRQGGTLICFNQFPVKDECGEPLKQLVFDPPAGARPLLLPVVVQYRKGRATLAKGGHMGRKVNFFFYPETAGEPVLLNTNAKAREMLVDIGASGSSVFPIGYSRRLGKGRLVLIGSNPCPELVRLALEQEGGMSVQCLEPGVLTNLHRHTDGGLVLFVTNRNASERRVTVRVNLKKAGVDPKGRYTVKRGLAGEPVKMKGRELAALDVTVPGHGVEWMRIGM
jgi:hypothetical protein